MCNKRGYYPLHNRRNNANRESRYHLLIGFYINWEYHGKSGAAIRYTTNGSDPTSASGTVYTGPFYVSETTTVKAIAYKTGKEDSIVTSVTVAKIIGAPTFSPAAGTFQVCPQISMSSATPGTSIKYTRDGSDPKTSPTATVYSSPFYFNGTIKAYSYVGTSLSAVVSATFNITGTLTAGKVPKTGQTTSYYAGDDGGFAERRGMADPAA